MRENFELGRLRWRGLGLYQRFEHIVVLILIGLIAVVVLAAVWRLVLKCIWSPMVTTGYDVVYEYNGQRFMTRLPYNPGSQLRVNVSVTPI